MQNDTNLRPNHSEVAAEVLDKEVIIIRLTDGIYYSMQGVGVLVWQLIETHNSVRDIVLAVTEHYQIEIDRVRKDLDELFAALLKERLVIVDGTLIKNVPNDFTKRSHIDTNYESPILNVYEDMNDLLALDPPTPGQQDLIFHTPADKD